MDAKMSMTERRIGLETEIIDKLYLELSQFTRARTNNDMLYHELIMAVGKKYQGESRHQTALRYIRQAEAPDNNGPACEAP